jgi:thiamine transporter ThiT
MQKIKEFSIKYMLEISFLCAVSSVVGLVAIVTLNPNIAFVCMLLSAPLYLLGFFHGETAEIARSRKRNDRQT